MPLGIHKRKWEKATVLAVVGLIGVAYAYTLVCMMFAPTTGVESIAEDAEMAQQVESPYNGTNVPVRSEEVRRLFRRSMTIHDPDAFIPGAGYKPEPQVSPDLFVPRVEARISPVSSVMDSSAFQPPPVARGPSRSREEQEEDEKKPSTGWGWLADDIADGRRDRRVEPGREDLRERTGQREQQMDDERDDEIHAREQQRAGAGADARRTRSDGAMFMDASRERVAREPSGVRSALREEELDRWVSRDPRDGAPGAPDVPVDAMADPVDPYGAGVYAGDPFGGGLVMRDPFVTPPANAGGPGDASTWLSVPSSAEAVFGFREPATPGGLAPSMPPRGFSAPVDHSGFSGGGDAFSSGGMFTPMGASGSRVDDLFSGSRAFDQGSAFGSPPMSESPGRRPSGVERAGPGALPW